MSLAEAWNSTPDDSKISSPAPGLKFRANLAEPKQSGCFKASWKEHESNND